MWSYISCWGYVASNENCRYYTSSAYFITFSTLSHTTLTFNVTRHGVLTNTVSQFLSQDISVATRLDNQEIMV